MNGLQNEFNNLMKNAFNYKLVHFKSKMPKLYSKLKFEQSKQLILPVLRNVLNPAKEIEMKVFKQVLNSLKGKIKKILKFFVLAFSSSLDIKIEILDLFYQFLTYFPFNFVYEDIFEYFGLYLFSFNTRTKDLIFQFIFKLFNGLNNKSFLESYEDLKTQNNESLIHFIDQNKQISQMEKTIAFHLKNQPEELSLMEKILYTDLFVHFNVRKHRFECIETICHYLRRFIPIAIFEIDDLNIIRNITQTSLNMKRREIQHMPYETFIQISKLFISLYEILVSVDKRNHKNTKALKPINFDIFVYDYLSFCICFFSENRHLAFKNTTIQSINNINKHKELIYRLVFIYKKIKTTILGSKILSDVLDVFVLENKSYYNKVSLNVNTALKHISSVKVNDTSGLGEGMRQVKTMNLVKAVLWLLKQSAKGSWKII